MTGTLFTLAGILLLCGIALAGAGRGIRLVWTICGLLFVLGIGSAIANIVGIIGALATYLVFTWCWLRRICFRSFWRGAITILVIVAFWALALIAF